MLIARLHFYIGLFVGPFIFIAALTGTLYVLTPQLEDALYRSVLSTPARGEAKPLAQQIAAAQSSLGEDLTLFAVRPAPLPGDTTRVMFLDPGVAFSGARAVFVDPVTLSVTGNLPVYGTSGVLPLRLNIDYMHRQLMLGEAGRYYSELAASWLWIVALGGLYLWWRGRGRRQGVPAASAPVLRTRRRHALLGVVLLPGLVFFSVTGLTWSKWAGDNIGSLRSELGWTTPSLSRELSPLPQRVVAAGTPSGGEHADHGHGGPDEEGLAHVGHAAQGNGPMFDAVLKAARDAGIDAHKLEIRPARTDNQAWEVREIDRRWPTQVDSVAVDPRTLDIVSRADFVEFPLVAKLIRWGVDAHMGILFGWVNQLLVAALGAALCVLIVWGYRMWWLRRPRAGVTSQPLLDAWAKLAAMQRWGVVAIALLLGLSLPLMGASLLAFLVVDGLRWRFGRQSPMRSQAERERAY